MREIPNLQTLCLRSIGSHSCSAEAVFCQTSDGSLSTASRLLRSFSKRPTTTTTFTAAATAAAAKKQRPNTAMTTTTTNQEDTMSFIPLARTPCIGMGSSRRVQANEVDLHHPIIACRDETTHNLIMWHGNAALDTLQSYIDSLVELGRMDDVRLGRHFWEEWKIAIILSKGRSEDATSPAPAPAPALQPSSKKRQKRQAQTQTVAPLPPSSLGALSLHNCVVGDETFEHLQNANLGPYLAVLDLTGVRGLTDELLNRLFPSAVNLRQLSLKNCRRITVKTLQLIATYQTKLECLDVGGAFNLDCHQIIETVVPKLPRLTSLHASGLGWSDDSLHALVQARDTWTQLSLSFSMNLSQSSLKNNLMEVADSLTSLALAFCETLVDNAALGLLGRNLPHVVSLDVRGNHQLNTMTGWYDGRVSADLPAQKLVVLGRYSGISENSVEETRRLHPVEANELVVILDGGGMGAGITRTDDGEQQRDSTSAPMDD